MLDIGCGTGRLAAALADRGARVWGVEPSGEMLEVARSRVPAGVGLKRASAESLPFTDGWFERAVFNLVLHLTDRPRALAEARRVLRPDGRLVIATFDPSYFDRHWLNRFFPSLEEIDRAGMPTREQLERELPAAGFASVSFSRLSQPASLAREKALEKIRNRWVSPLQLLSSEEFEAGLERAARELPQRLDYILEWLVAVATAPAAPGAEARPGPAG